jgi:hypothetical protein
MEFEFEWEEIDDIESTDGFHVGDFVGKPGDDWDMKVIWPCVVTKIVKKGKIEICECFSHKFNNHYPSSTGYRIVDTRNIQRWNNKKQLDWYKKLEKQSKWTFTDDYKKWLDFVDEHKDYDRLERRLGGSV